MAAPRALWAEVVVGEGEGHGPVGATSDGTHGKSGRSKNKADRETGRTRPQGSGWLVDRTSTSDKSRRGPESRWVCPMDH